MKKICPGCGFSDYISSVNITYLMRDGKVIEVIHEEPVGDKRCIKCGEVVE